MIFEKKPEISETLEWMLQSRQVGDEILVKTLVHELYAEIQRFSISLLQDVDQFRINQFVEQVICAGVGKAQEYRQDYPVKVWLFRLAVELFQKLKGMQKAENILGSADTGHQSLAREARKLIDAMPEVSRLAFQLKFSHHLSNQQIGYILDFPISEVERRLDRVGYKWLEWLGEGTGSQASEYRNQDFYNKLWPPMELSAEKELEISQRVLAYLGEKERRKHRLVILGELLLVMMAVAVVAGMGRFVTIITPRPTSEIVYQTQLVNQVVLISPTPGPTVPPTPFPDHAILYRAEGGETLGDIADQTFINVAIIEALNDIPASQPLEVGQKIMIGMTESGILMPTPEGNLPTPSTPLATNKPLTSESSQEEILQQITQSGESWQTLWAEALVIQYGPQGFVGEPDLRRQQIWNIQPYYNYLLDGENGGEVENVYTSIGGLITKFNLYSGEEISNDGAEQIHLLPDLQQMLNGNDFTEIRIGEFEFLKQEPISGRDTLVLDWYVDPETFQGGAGGKGSSRVHHGRYWVDSSLGLILRQQKFNGNDLTQLFEETIVTKIEINVPIPNRLFGRTQPIQTYFAQDYRGDPTTHAVIIPEYVLADLPSRKPIDHQPVPPDYPVEDSRLTFQWTSLEKFNPQLGTRVDVFGDGYYLSNIEFSAPRQLFCTRSADGNLIAYFSRSDNLPDGYSRLGWLNLHLLPQVNYPLPEIIPYDFAFSPDNRQLAIYGCEREGEHACGIYLVEISSGESTLLTQVERGNGLMWSQDSDALAIQGSFLRQGKWRVLVFDAETGNVIFDGPFDWEGFWVSPESPIHDWGVSYPPIRGGLECVDPPQGG